MHAFPSQILKAQKMMKTKWSHTSEKLEPCLVVAFGAMVVRSTAVRASCVVGFMFGIEVNSVVAFAAIN